jgi:hypothetical protein
MFSLDLPCYLPFFGPLSIINTSLSKSLTSMHALPDDSQYAPSTQHNATKPCETLICNLNPSESHSRIIRFESAKIEPDCLARLTSDRQQMTHNINFLERPHSLTSQYNSLSTNFLIPPSRLSYDNTCQQISLGLVTRAHCFGPNIRKPRSFSLTT